MNDRRRDSHSAERTRLGGIALLTLVIAAGAWLLFGGNRDAAIGPAPVAAATSNAMAAATESQATSTAPPVATDQQSRQAVPTSPSQASELDPVPPGEVRVQGTVIAIDPKGKEHPSQDGTIHLTAWRTDTGSGHEVTVHEGRFTVDVPRETTAFSFDRVVLGDRMARVAEERVAIAETIELRATWHAPTILRVVDAEYGLDLIGVTAVAATDWRTDDCPHPGGFPASAQRVTDGRSPLELALDTKSAGTPRWQETLWVHSPGYAWGRVTVDYASPTERRLELHRGGTLQIRIQGSLPTKKATSSRWSNDDDNTPRLRVREVEMRPDIEKMVQEALEELAGQPSALPGGRLPTAAELRKVFAQQSAGKLVAEADAGVDAPMVIAGVTPGQYEVRVELGHHWDSPLVLGSSDATVVAGETRQVTVQVDPPPDRQTVPLAGTLLLPPAWSLQHLSLNFEPMDITGKSADLERDIQLSAMKPDAAMAGLYHWDAGLVAPSRYEVTCYTLDIQWVVDTGPNGNRSAEIVAGEPVDVAIELLDDTTSRPIDDAQVLWNGQRPEGVRGGSLGNSLWNVATKRYEFRVAAGRVEVHVWGEYSTVGNFTFDVSPNQRKFVVRARRNFGIDVFLKAGESRIPWDDEARFAVTVKRLDANGTGSGIGGAPGNGLRLTVSEPGTYRVTIPDLTGFEPVPPFDVDVRAGEFTEHEVKLLPRR